MAWMTFGPLEAVCLVTLAITLPVLLVWFLKDIFWPRLLDAVESLSERAARGQKKGEGRKPIGFGRAREP